MFKKVLIATLAVVFGLAVIKGTWIGSHLRMRFCNAGKWVKERIPPEQEIARLRMELENLAKEDDKHFDKVARQIIAVEKFEKNVANLKKDLTTRETKIRKMREALAREGEIVLDGQAYDRSDVLDQVRLDARNFQADEATLKSKEDHLKAMKRNLAINKKKLADLKVVREQMATELQKLETALAEERQIQAQQAATLDDASYIELRKSMDSLSDRIKQLKVKRELKGEAINGPVRATERQREQDAKLDKYLETRFGPQKEVVNK
jgi:hypothetical protein